MTQTNEAMQEVMESRFTVLAPAGVMSTPHQRKRQTQQQGGVIYPLLTASDMERLRGGVHRRSSTAVIVPTVFTQEHISVLP